MIASLEPCRVSKSFERRQIPMGISQTQQKIDTKITVNFIMQSINEVFKWRAKLINYLIYLFHNWNSRIFIWIKYRLWTLNGGARKCIFRIISVNYYLKVNYSSNLRIDESNKTFELKPVTNSTLYYSFQKIQSNCFIYNSVC